MRIIRYLKNHLVSHGILDGELVQPIADFRRMTTDGDPFPLSEVKLLTPSAPTKIVCAGLNYRDHADEMGFPIPEEPVIFLKPPSAVLEPGGTIPYPMMTSRLEYEAELAVVIGKTAKGVREETALDYVLGYTCINDVTARDLQKRDGQWTRAKSFDGFAPFGPWIETDIEPQNLLIEAYLNGERKQSSSTANMIFTVARLVSFISQVMTLNAGDVIATGTPPGIGRMERGDRVEVRISGIGSLVNIIES
ncbi:MAG: fumarylacetoacetate hydrolase family protein [Nitrospirota bacterium]